ncbi:ribosomal-protein-L7/L12-serine acetyltransferase [compost metagenome]
MTEAVGAITKYAIEHLEANRIEIRCDSRNVGSAQVAERSGFTLEGILRNEVCDVEGSLSSTKVFAKIKGVEF